MSRLLRLYLRCLERYPWRTQALSTGVLMASGDVIAQFAVEKKSLSQYEPVRTSRFLIFGTFGTGPVIRGWYLILERAVKSAPKVAAIQKMVLDQSLFAPMFLFYFLNVMTYWKTKDADLVREKVSQDYWTILMANYKLWPAAQIINFYLVPFQHRIMYVNVIALAWNTYLAYKSEQEITTSQNVEIKDFPNAAINTSDQTDKRS